MGDGILGFILTASGAVSFVIGVLHLAKAMFR